MIQVAGLTGSGVAQNLVCYAICNYMEHIKKMAGAMRPPSSFPNYFMLFRSRYLRASVLADVAAQVLDRIDQKLDNVLGIVHERAWVLLYVLIIVGSAEQCGSPIAIVGNERTCVIRISFAVFIGIQEVVWVARGIIQN